MRLLHPFIARQLRAPSGLVGRHVVARIWNRHNQILNDASLELIKPRRGDRLLEVGFGGGYLLGRLLDQVGRGGPSPVSIAPRRW